MAGAIAIVIGLLLFPVAIFIGGGFISAILGNSLQRDGERRGEGTELATLDD